MLNVSPIIAPDKALMLQHLELLFGRALSGRIEISTIKVAAGEGEKSFPVPFYFDVGDLDAAAEHAAEANAVPGHNVYVGAALRRETVFPGRTASDDDFLKTYALFADADTPEQRETARRVYRERNITPPFIVVTGRVPYTRAQMWWPLESGIDDLEEARVSLRGIADALGTDHAVCTGKQLMRLAGGVSWPKKEDRILERTEVITPANAQRGFELEQVHFAFPPAARSQGGGVATDVIVAPAGSLGLDEKVMDGREGYAFSLVTAHLHELIGTTGCVPSADELFADVWPVYSRKVDQVRAGRGPTFLRQKCADRLNAFHRGQIPFMRDLDEAVATWVERAEVRAQEPATQEYVHGDHVHQVGQSSELFEVLTIAGIKAMPDADWIVEEALPKGGLGFIYGPPASFKSFICADLALSCAYGLPEWIGRKVKHRGSVLYLASEGVTGIKNRIAAWQLKNGLPEDDGAFRLIRSSMSFMQAGDVDRLERTVAAIVAEAGPVDTVFVDTVSRVLPGADENLQKDMTLFVAACDRLREQFGATVVGVHHTNKQGDMRGSTVFLGQGDFVMRIERDERSKSGVLTCEKQKEAEDGWQVAFQMETREWTPAGRIKPVSSLTVAWGGEPEPEENDEGKWPDRETCRAIVAEIQNAWVKGKPWSPYPQTAKEGRFAPRNISRAFGVQTDTAKNMIEAWLSNDVLAFEVFDSHSKQRGLKVERGLG